MNSPCLILPILFIQSQNHLVENKPKTSFNSSVITTVTDHHDDSAQSVVASSFIYKLVGLIIKAIAFQTTLLLGFPIWLLFSIIRRVKRYLVKRVSMFLRLCLGYVKRVFKKNKSKWKLCMKVGWGLLCSAFVGFVLVGLLVFAVVVSGLMMKCFIDKPVKIIEQLNFDYTRDDAPIMAFVPIMSCPDQLCLDCGENIAKSARVIPLDHKLFATVSLTMPESDYNRNLGIFQVRVDFLSRYGKPLASKTQPCMLQFKSQPIRLLMTVLKLAPLITGYSAESQTLDIKFKGYSQREIPTSCLRVVLEPRAEFAKTGGAPEIYTAYLKLESQLPLLKRILWSWKATVFVWTSIVIFTVGVVLMLLCCTSIIVPWLRPRTLSLNNNASR